MSRFGTQLIRSLKDIDGKEVSVTQFPGTEGLKILTKLSKLVGPVIGGALGISGSVADVDTSDPDFLPRIVTDLFSSIEEDDTVRLIHRMLRDTRVGGVEIMSDFDMMIGGNYPFLFKLLGYVLEVNYGNFFEGSLGKKVSQAVDQLVQ